MEKTRKLYGSGVHQTRTGMKYNFNGSSSIKPLTVREIDVMELLSIMSKGKALIHEVRQENDKIVIEVVEKEDEIVPETIINPVDKIKEEDETDVIVNEIISIDETPEPELPELGTTEELLEEVVGKEDIPDWENTSYLDKRIFAKDNGYSGENGYKEDVLNDWFKRFIED